MSSRLSETEYENALDAAAQEWRRVRIWTAGGQVIRFALQYETTLAGERVPVVRYDTAHGFAHRDRLNRRGDIVDKRPLAGDLPLAVALDTAMRDIETNWRRYLEDFLRGEK